MLSAYLIKQGMIEIKEVPCPEPSANEVLVKIKSALTCGTDLKAFIRGHNLIPMPGKFGHEFSGEIAMTGKGVKKFKQGDNVMCVHTAPCLKCEYCKNRLFNLCNNIMQTKILGAFSEYIIVPSYIVNQNMFIKSDNISFQEAAFLEPLSCVIHSIKGLNLKKESKVLIIGSGAIGLLHLLLAKKIGAIVIISGLQRQKLKIAKTLDADFAIMPTEITSVIKELTNGIGVDIVFECTGQVNVWEESVNYVRRGGTVILFGGCKEGTKVTYNTQRLHYDEITLKGSFHFMPSDVREAYNLLKNGLNVKPLITKQYSLKNINKAFEKLSKRQGIKYAIMP